MHSALWFLISCDGGEEPAAEPAAAAPTSAPLTAQPQAAAPQSQRPDRSKSKGKGRGKRNREPVDYTAFPVDAWMTNPISGAKLAVYLSLPEGDGPFPALVVMPAGLVSGAEQAQDYLDVFTDAGIAVVRWDPDGRGNSTGEEDKGGEIHQAGLRQAVTWAIANEKIIDDKVGLLSFSYGVTAATAVLAKDNPGARFLIDWEGPASRTWTGCGEDNRPAASKKSCEDEAYWQSREASVFIRSADVPYLRIQSANDHVHGTDRGLALEMVENAMAGSSGWVRLNDNPPNTPADDLKDVPLPAIRGRALHEQIVTWALEMFAMLDDKASQ